MGLALVLLRIKFNIKFILVQKLALARIVFDGGFKGGLHLCIKWNWSSYFWMRVGTHTVPWRFQDVAFVWIKWSRSANMPSRKSWPRVNYEHNHAQTRSWQKLTAGQCLHYTPRKPRLDTINHWSICESHSWLAVRIGFHGDINKKNLSMIQLE